MTPEDDRRASEFYADPEHRKITGPGRKRKGQPRRLTGVVPVRFAPEVIERVKRLAHGEGITVSAWIRRTVIREEERQRRRWLDAHRHELEVIPGSGRAVFPRTIPSTLSLGTFGGGLRTFSCPHMSIGNVTSASCGVCGPMQAAA